MDEGKNGKLPGLTELLGRMFPGRPRVTEEKIQEIMDAGEEEGVINEEENEMIRSILRLRDTVVREVMVPRTDMAAVPMDATFQDILQEVIRCGHSRLPVYDGSIDNIVGLVYAKDLLKYCGISSDTINLKRILRPPYFIPESKNLEQLLQEFKKKRVHLAVVMDEYGGTAGLVTIEDLLEEIVGDIQDEYDVEEELLQQEADGSVTVDARLPIEELAEHFGLEIERDKFDSVGGLFIHLAGRIPRVGDEVVTADLHLTVLEADQRKVRRLRVVRRSEEGDG